MDDLFLKSVRNFKSHSVPPMASFFTAIEEVSISQERSLNCYETGGYNNPFQLPENRAIMLWQKHSLPPSKRKKPTAEPIHLSRTIVKDVEQYIEFYNEKRPHRSLAYKTPAHFEELFGKK